MSITSGDRIYKGEENLSRRCDIPIKAGARIP